MTTITRETAAKVQAAAVKAQGGYSETILVNARTVRAALKAARVAHVIERITSGRRTTHVALEGTREDRNTALAALRVLWVDASDRLWTMDYTGTIEHMTSVQITRRSKHARGMVDLESLPTEAELDEAHQEALEADREAEAAEDYWRVEEERSRIEQDRADEESARMEREERLYRDPMDDAPVAESCRSWYGDVEVFDPNAEPLVEDASTAGATPAPEVIRPEGTTPEYRSHWGHIDLGGAREMVRRETLEPGDMAWSSHYGLRTVGYVRTTGETTEVVWMGRVEDGFQATETYGRTTTVPLFSRATEEDTKRAAHWLATLHAITRSEPCRTCGARVGELCRVMATPTTDKLGGHWARYWAAHHVAG